MIFSKLRQNFGYAVTLCRLHIQVHLLRGKIIYPGLVCRVPIAVQIWNRNLDSSLFERLKHLSSLAVVTLDGCNIRGEDLRALANLPELTLVSMQDTKLVDSSTSLISVTSILQGFRSLGVVAVSNISDDAEKWREFETQMQTRFPEFIFLNTSDRQDYNKKIACSLVALGKVL